MLLDRVLMFPVLVGAAALGATAAHADNEFFQRDARTCTPYVTTGCDEVGYVGPLSGATYTNGTYAFSGGHDGGVSIAAATFAPGGAPVLENGSYVYSAIADTAYDFHVGGPPNTWVPLHMVATVSTAKIHLTDVDGNVASLADGVVGTSPNRNFNILENAYVRLKIPETPGVEPASGTDVTSWYLGGAEDVNSPYCIACNGAAATLDSIFWVMSNQTLSVQIDSNVQIKYTVDGLRPPVMTFATASAAADPVFSIDDPAYSGFTIVGVPDGPPPPPMGGVPEPASWAMMFGGFGLVGGAMRRRSDRKRARANPPALLPMGTRNRSTVTPRLRYGARRASLGLVCGGTASAGSPDETRSSLTGGSMISSGNRQRAMVAALISAVGLCGSTSAHAAITQIASAQDFTMNDAVSWGQLLQYPSGVGAFFSPAVAHSIDGLELTVSNNSGPSFGVAKTGSEGYHDIGNPLDFMLSNCCNFRPDFNYGDLTLTFSSAVRGVGVYAIFAGDKHYTITAEVNGDPGLRYSVSGDPSLPPQQLQLVFLGVMSDALDIKSLTFTSDELPFHWVDLDNLRLNTLPPPPPSSSAPEPASWAMLVGGFGMIGGALRRHRPRLAV